MQYYSGRVVKPDQTKLGSTKPNMRKCYDKILTEKYYDEKLVWMMLLDGCSLLQFIRMIDDMINVLKVHEIDFV